MSRNGTVRTNPAKMASPKVHPAPAPPKAQTSTTGLQNNLGEGIRAPTWPATIPTRVKKLSWGDDSQNKVRYNNYVARSNGSLIYNIYFQTDSDSIENVNNIDTANLDPVHRIVDNSNLTVYF